MAPHVQPTTLVAEAVAAHAQHIVAGDATAIRQDCAPNVLQTPADLYAQLAATAFERYAIVGHAKIGLQHVFKIRYVGAMVVTLHHRLGETGGKWFVLESERV
jgi:hypothetical protein